MHNNHSPVVQSMNSTATNKAMTNAGRDRGTGVPLEEGTPFNNAFKD